MLLVMKFLTFYVVLCMCFVNTLTNFTAYDIFAQYFKIFNNKSALYSGDEVYATENHKLFSDLEKKCYDDITYVFRHLKSKWSIQMLDSNGKVPSGTLLGNGLWMGKYQECLDVYMPADVNSRQGDIHGLYCIATWKVTIPTNFGMPLQQLPVKTGLCLPSSCNTLDIQKDVKYIMYFLHRLPFLKQYGHILNLNSLTCKGAEPRQLTAPALMFLYILGVYFSLVLIGSFATVMEYALGRNKTTPQDWDDVTSTHSSVFTQFESGEEFSAENEIENFPDDQRLCIANTVQRKRCTTVSRLSFRNGVKFLKCFCLFSNAAKILDTSTSGKNFPCIHGIRFLSMAWVVLGHTYVHNINIIGNFMDLLHGIDNLPFQVITQGTFSVDSFFLISGFLFGYLYLEESDKRRGKISWLGLICHRLLRITPVYMLLVAFNTLIFKYTNSGPFWGDESDTSVCKRYWWWNLLYINNFLPLDSMCVTWTWYLANDLQFFMIGLLLLNIFWRWPTVGLVLTCTALSCSWIITGYLSYRYDLTPLFSGMTTATDYEIYKNKLVLTWNLIYTKPYCRIGPYLVGLLLAYFMNRNPDQTRHLKWPLKVLGWGSATFCSLSVVYGVYHMEDHNAILLHFYNALSRTSFGLGVAWVIYCCVTGNGDLVNRILSLKVWIPLSRLTYCAYLFHPLIMSWYFESQETPLYFTQTNMVMFYFAFLVVSYATAFVVSIIFEAPVINLEKIFRQKFF